MPISVLSINSMTQSVHVRQCERELCVYFKKLYNVSLENPAYSSATISACSECDVKCLGFFFFTAYYLKIDTLGEKQQITRC